MNRKDALNAIRCEVAEHGEVTRTAMRIYSEHRISYEAFKKVVKQGKNIFKSRENKGSNGED